MPLKHEMWSLRKFQERETFIGGNERGNTGKGGKENKGAKSEEEVEKPQKGTFFFH